MHVETICSKSFMKLLLRVEGGHFGDEAFGVAVRPSAPLRLYGNNEDLHLSVAYVSSLLAHFLAEEGGSIHCSADFVLVSPLIHVKEM